MSRLLGWARDAWTKELEKHRLGQLAVVAFLSGAIWRAFHVLKWHNPTDPKWIYSDMSLYHDLGRRLADPAAVVQASDVTHPPGLTVLVAWCFRHDPSLESFALIQLVVSILCPLALGALAWALFDKLARNVAIIGGSAYYPFVEFSGFMLAEIYFAF